MTAGRTPAQMYALLLGAVLLLVGVVGFIADASFGSGGDVQGSDLIVFEVNGWHNLVHIASGLAGLLLARTNATARLYAFGFGAVYAIVTLWGLIDGSSVLGIIPVNGPDNVLHLAIAAVGILAAVASPSGEPGARRGAPAMREA